MALPPFSSSMSSRAVSGRPDPFLAAINGPAPMGGGFSRPPMGSSAGVGGDMGVSRQSGSPPAGELVGPGYGTAVDPKTAPTMPFFESLLREYNQGDFLNDLAIYVHNSWMDAKRHRIQADVERDIMRSMRAVRAEYDPEDRALIDGVDIYMNITNQKCRSLKAWIGDILANSEDQPWTLKPTPSPELPPEAEEAVIDALIREMKMYGLTVDLRERAAYFKDVAQKHSDKLAEKTTARMETKIKDIMLEGGWRDAFTSFISDLSEFPAAILKGPVVERGAGLRWTGESLATVDRLRYVMKRVHPLDFYPSPNSTTPQDGNYVIERARVTYEDLLETKDIPGFNEQAIRKILVERPGGVREIVQTDQERSRLEHTDRRQTLTSDNRYDILIYYGKVKGDLLAKHQVEVDDPQKMYEAEVWICGGLVLRALLNPHPLGKRPYYTCSFENVPGSIWGRGLPQIIRDVQRICNSAARSLVRNMAFASGPIGEYDIDRLANETNIDELRPWRMYATQTDQFNQQTSQPALRFTDIKSNAAELLKVYEFYSKIADDQSGIPAYVLGNPQTAGAGRTLGGLSMLMGNAAKGVKAVIAGIDRRVIEPAVTSFYMLLMLFDKDRTLKADVAVIARGSSGLLQRELQQARAVETLQMLTPYAERGLVPPRGLQLVIRDILRGLGYAADDIVPDPDRQQQLADLAQRYGVASQQPEPQEDGGPGDQSSSQPGTPGPKLDGRSQPGGVDPGTAQNLPANRGA